MNVSHLMCTFCFTILIALSTSVFCTVILQEHLMASILLLSGSSAKITLPHKQNNILACPLTIEGMPYKSCKGFYGASEDCCICPLLEQLHGLLDLASAVNGLGNTVHRRGVAHCMALTFYSISLRACTLCCELFINVTVNCTFSKRVQHGIIAHLQLKM